MCPLAVSVSPDAPAAYFPTPSTPNLDIRSSLASQGPKVPPVLKEARLFAHELVLSSLKPLLTPPPSPPQLIITHFRPASHTVLQRKKATKHNKQTQNQPCPQEMQDVSTSPPCPSATPRRSSSPPPTRAPPTTRSSMKSWVPWRTF